MLSTVLFISIMTCDFKLSVDCLKVSSETDIFPSSDILSITLTFVILITL
jgi:hypothetical protein